MTPFFSSWHFRAGFWSAMLFVAVFLLVVSLHSR